MRHSLLYIACLGFLLIAASCGGTRQAIWFNNNDRNDSLIRTQPIVNDFQTIIQKDDILSLNVSSISSITPENDPVRVFREGGTQFTVTATTGGGGSPGYLVDADGFIDYPVLGKVQMAGLTIRGAKEALIQKLKLYVKDPVVEVRIINYKVVILGEVGAPGTIIAPNHKINIIEALAAAGGIPITGRKDNILIIRQENGQRIEAHVNLNSREVFNSPYYYLRQNDIIYVEPGVLRRQANNNFTQLYLPIFSTLLTTGLAIFGVVQLVRRPQ